MSDNKKEKVINVGVTDEIMEFMEKWTAKSFEENEKKEEKPGLEVKRVIVEILKKELGKIKEAFEKENITDEEWDKCVMKTQKISEIVQWY